MFVVLVWAPLFLLPASRAFYLYSRATASTVDAQVFQEFQAGGHLAIPAPTSLIVGPNNDRNTVPVALGRSIVKTGVNLETSATSHNAPLPAALIVTVPRKGSANAVVIPAAGTPTTATKTRIVGVKP